jgi:hypothetical protein
VLESDNPDAHVRVGWSQELGPLQGPCGADDFSYSYGDKAGCAFHRRYVNSKDLHMGKSGKGFDDIYHTAREKRTGKRTALGTSLACCFTCRPP